MGETTVNKLPYPVDGDAPDGPSQIKALAELLDTLKWGSRNLKPTLGVVRSSSGLANMSTSYTDVPGAKLEITPATAQQIAIVGSFDMSVHANASATTCEAVAGINLDGSIQTGTANLQELAPATNVIIQASVVQVWLLNLTAAAHTIKVQAKKGSGTEAGINAASFLYALFSQ